MSIDIAKKLRNLRAVVGSIEKQFGKGAIMAMGEENVNESVRVIPTGSLALDHALGVGGYPRGRIVEIYGPESSDKTTLALHAMREGQRGVRLGAGRVCGGEPARRRRRWRGRAAGRRLLRAPRPLRRGGAPAGGGGRRGGSPRPSSPSGAGWPPERGAGLEGEGHPGGGGGGCWGQPPRSGSVTRRRTGRPSSGVWRLAVVGG